jgi:hypothetical protein
MSPRGGINLSLNRGAVRNNRENDHNPFNDKKPQNTRQKVFGL